MAIPATSNSNSALRLQAIRNLRSFTIPKGPEQSCVKFGRNPQDSAHISVLGVDSGRSGRRPICPSIIQHDRLPLHLDLVSRSRSNVIVISPSIQVTTSPSACHLLPPSPYTEPHQSFLNCPWIVLPLMLLLCELEVS
jgi:hypothetical protein